MSRQRIPLLSRLSANPEIFGGKPIIRDMRTSVEMILNLLAQGASPQELLNDYPGLESEDIQACIAYTHAVIANDTIDFILPSSKSRSMSHNAIPG